MAKAQFEVTIEEDGTVSISTGNLQGPSHHSADDFIKMLQVTLGHDFTVKRNKGHIHSHSDGVTHQHGEAT